jgi:hypothetical protein
MSLSRWLLSACALALFSTMFSALQAAPVGSAATASTLTPEELETLWKNLGQNDDEGARQALVQMRRLIAHPQVVVPFLKNRLQPVPAPDLKRIEKSISELDSPTFNEREKAMHELEGYGDLVLPILQRQLQRDLPSLELRNRLRRVVATLEEREPLTPEELRGLRGIAILEGIGTPEARAVLTTLASGAEGARLTGEARHALANLATLSAEKNR